MMCARQVSAMREMANVNLFDTFAEDLLEERNARSLIIVGASKVDNLLLQILNAYLLPKRAKAKEPDELLDGDRPLGAFSARIKMCYRLGLIEETLCHVLEKLRQLRNPSAHSVAFDIMKSPTREHLADLCNSVTKRNSFRHTRECYFHSTPLNNIEELQCVLLTLCVLLEAIRKKTSTTRGSKTALRIANR